MAKKIVSPPEREAELDKALLCRVLDRSNWLEGRTLDQRYKVWLQLDDFLLERPTSRQAHDKIDAVKNFLIDCGISTERKYSTTRHSEILRISSFHTTVPNRHKLDMLCHLADAKAWEKNATHTDAHSPTPTPAYNLILDENTPDQALFAISLLKTWDIESKAVESASLGGKRLRLKSEAFEKLAKILPSLQEISISGHGSAEPLRDTRTIASDRTSF